ncbi:MAG: hypothetical protein AAF349_24295, partial [Cyanobacteria bacterium P01_A01_bin.68]
LLWNYKKNEQKLCAPFAFPSAILCLEKLFMGETPKTTLFAAFINTIPALVHDLDSLLTHITLQISTPSSPSSPSPPSHI